ncbi:MAG: hypothetical protein H6696_13295 [Deferribacteres bacterium]|nr:hypothetical protein [candidate division KSB1 bacterium]MCB9502906.1 hypothetical protein [Deferribacteres bacterium]
MENDFWTSEKIYLTGALGKRVLSGKDKVSWGYVKSLELPEILRSTLLNQAKMIFKTEKPLRIIQSSRFDFSLPILKAELATLREIFLETVIFTAEEINNAIQFSVNLGFDILTRPQSTCLAILYDTSLERTREDVQSILSGLSIGAPFVKSLIEYFESHDKNIIKKAHFKQISEDIQSVLYGENPHDIFLEEIKLLLDFYKDIGDDMEENLSAEIIQGMFTERGLDSYAVRIQQKSIEKPFWNLDDVHNFLSLNEDAEYFPDTETTRLTIVESEATAEEEIEEIEQEKERTSPLDDEFLPINDDIDSDDLENIVDDDLDELEDISDFDESLLIPDEVAEAPHTLYTLIDESAREMFIRNIFQGNEQEYEEFISRLESQENWHKAKQLMDDEFINRGISFFSKETIKFGDVLFKRYISRGKY